MTEKERLVELISAMPAEMEIEDFADYLLENGVIVSPILVGTKVYTKSLTTDKSIIPVWVTALVSDEDGVYSFWSSGGELSISAEFLVDDIGKTVFLTYEEAERAK